MHFFDDQVFHVGNDVAQLVLVTAHVGGHVLQDGFFAEVELDHLGHVGVDRLVVGHTRAHRIADRHVACAVRTHEARAAQCGRGAEDFGVEEVVVHPAVDHIHLAQAARGAHPHKVVLDQQVLTFNQLHTHLLGEECMLKVGAVVHAGGQHHHGGLCSGGRRGGTQGFEQQVGVMGDGRDAVLAEQVGEQTHHHLAVFQHVAHTAGHPQVVFEHVVLTVALGVGRTHDVNACDLGVNLVGHVHTHHLGSELGVVQDLLGRDDTGLDDVLVVVDVMDEAVQGGHTLDQALFHAAPLVRRDDARDQVERDEPLRTRAVFVLGAIHREGDADPSEDHLCFFAP